MDVTRDEDLEQHNRDIHNHKAGMHCTLSLKQETDLAYRKVRFQLHLKQPEYVITKKPSKADVLSDRRCLVSEP